MFEHISSIVFVLASIISGFVCYHFHTWGIYEICFIVLGFIFTILLQKQSKKLNLIFVCIVVFLKPFIVLADELYDPMSLLMGIPLDILFTAFGLLIGYIIAKIMLFLFKKLKNSRSLRLNKVDK